MKIIRYKEIGIEITETELCNALMEIILKKLGEGENFTDGGLDWITYHNYTYIGNSDRIVSNDLKIADLVNAMNIIKYGKRLEI